MKADDLETQLLNLVKQFISEYKSERAIRSVSLEASLERDLGIDSLGRVELFTRIEKTFSVSLPENLMVEADSVIDLARALKNAGTSRGVIQGQFAETLDQSRLDPSTSNTLVEVLLRHCALQPERPHIYLQNEKGEEEIITYGQLLAESQKVAAGLLNLGLMPQETVAIMLPTSKEFFYAFFGVLLAGGLPVPIYPPMRPDKIEEYAVREASILNNAEVRVLITFNKVESLGKLLGIFIKSLKAVVTVDMLKAGKHRIPHMHIESQDPALIQYTSGSTSDPKGVLLTHANLLANIRSVGKAVNFSAKDVGISWLPLYHDMGLIGAWFCTLYYGFPLTIMSPLTFLSRPERWLWAIHYHRGTLSAGPNFAYELCVRKIRDEDIQGLDLSSWRLAFNGAEAINPRTIERFTKKFEPYGFKSECFYPVYGLAENSVALTFPPLNRGPKIDVILREPFEKEGKAIPATSVSTSTLEFVDCGRPIPDHDVRIVDENGAELPERSTGYLHFTGPSAMQGYFRNPEATKSVYHEGWWDTGDIGYIAEGEVYITGRKKDVIIKAGRNLYPQEIEEVTAQVSGVRKGCVVAFGVSDPKMGTEKLVVVAETNEASGRTQDDIIKGIVDRVTVVLNIPPDQVVLVPPRTIPKTSSGKLQRSATKQLYIDGKLGKHGLRIPFWMQVSKLFFKGMFISLRRYLGKFFRFLYSTYVFVLLLIFFPVAWLSVMLLPLSTGKQTVQSLMKVFLSLIGHTSVTGKENLISDKPTVFVANHASYIDSLYLFALLPKNVLFVMKKEILEMPLVGKAVKKLGFIAVDRIDFTKNISDTNVIGNALQNGHSLLIYPEGTFTYATGLRPFKLGAFKVAVDALVPIVPIALNGTRNLMRGDSLLLKPSSVHITVCKAILPEDKDWTEVTRLHALARAEIAKYCGESAIDLVMAGPNKL